MSSSVPLTFVVQATCSRTRARVGILRLKRTNSYSNNNNDATPTKDNNGEDFLPCDIETPIFMPVGTSGTMKGLTPDQVESTGCRLMLSNTYHLASRPGTPVIQKAGGLHSFMKWPHGLLTDSGGFQMVSLSSLMEVSEEGVNFESPYEKGIMLNLPPEESIRVQQTLGSNIMMQLDDVVSATANDDVRYEEAMNRSVRWLDRCLKENESKKHLQSLFPIIQGGLSERLRRESVKQIVDRDTFGIAIGGLSGGEAKEKFVEMVSISTEDLPPNKPRYLMGVGFAVDLLLCSALGCDMFDCVYPTRTARFGTALIGEGTLLNFRNTSLRLDKNLIEHECNCSTCKGGYSRSYIQMLFQERNPIGCHLLTVHNISFQMRFMQRIRDSIREGRFVPHMYQVLDHHFGSKDKYPLFVKRTLDILGIVCE